MKDDIGIPNHNYSTRQKTNFNVIVPKMRTAFEQHCSQYTFIKYCTSHNLNISHFHNYKMYKKYVDNLF